MKPFVPLARASAPTRVDLAGGTLDIWPLYLLVGGAVTVNAALGLRARAEAGRRDGGGSLASSIDLGVETDVAAGAGTPDRLPLHAAVLRHLAPDGGIALRTESGVPAGSGLGGSSSLAVAMLAAVAAAAGLENAVDGWVEVARDLEAIVIQAPTGTQDHLAAVHGGVSAISYGPGGASRTALPVAAADLEARGILLYLGASRASARANSDMIRRVLDGDPATRRGLSSIAGIARDMESALRRGDLDACARLLGEEWAERRGLSPEVSTPATEEALAVARKAGASGGKICGAGGGGCLFVMAPPPGRARVAGALAAAGFRLLDFRVDPRGLTLEPPGGAGV